MSGKKDELQYWKDRAIKMETLLANLVLEGNTNLWDMPRRELANLIADLTDSTAVLLLMVNEESASMASNYPQIPEGNKYEKLIKSVTGAISLELDKVMSRNKSVQIDADGKVTDLDDNLMFKKSEDDGNLS